MNISGSSNYKTIEEFLFVQRRQNTARTRKYEGCSISQRLIGRSAEKRQKTSRKTSKIKKVKITELRFQINQVFKNCVNLIKINFT